MGRFNRAICGSRRIRVSTSVLGLIVGTLLCPDSLSAQQPFGQYEVGSYNINAAQVRFEAVLFNGKMDLDTLKEVARQSRVRLESFERTHLANQYYFTSLPDWSRTLLLVYYDATNKRSDWFAVALEDHWYVMDSSGQKKWVLRNKGYQHYRTQIHGATVTMEFHNPENENGYHRNSVGYKFWWR